MNRFFIVATLAAAFALSGVPAGQAKKLGHTSGPAAGTHVEPSTSVQKRNPHLEEGDHSGIAAGAPGVEGAKGTQSGRHHGRPRKR